MPSGLVGLAADKDFNTLVALGSQEMLVYDIASGARESVFLAKELYREVSQGSPREPAAAPELTISRLLL